MAIMNEGQQSLLTQLEEAKVVYDAWEDALRKEVADRKWEEKANIRRLVQEARAMKVPMRQIGFALGTADHKTLKDYETGTRRDQ